LNLCKPKFDRSQSGFGLLLVRFKALLKPEFSAMRGTDGVERAIGVFPNATASLRN
jgi:hypothetical protein